VIISVTIPDALVPRMRRAINASFPGVDPNNTLTAKQVADKVTAEFWRGVLVEFEHESAELDLIDTRRNAERAAAQAVEDARAKVVADAATIA
jgi:hypothetical protein